MSRTPTDSNESLSIYETPLNSPSNESLLNSTRIDSSLFSNTSPNTQPMDVLDFGHSFESIPTSNATESTLRQTVCRINSECNEGTVYWSSNIPKNHLLDSNTDLYSLWALNIRELENQELELISVEQQIQSLSIKCRSIREKMSANTNAIHSIINELLPKKKQMSQKETQTDFEDNQSVPHTLKSNKSTVKSQNLTQKSSVPSFNSNILSEPKNLIKTILYEKHFNELSEDMKNGLSRLPAMVKGYLTRRLMKTDKVLLHINTIRDTTQLLSDYSKPSKKVTVEDLDFHKRLMIQLENSCHHFYDIFFNYSKSSQMILIQNSRQHILERHYRTVSALSTCSYMEASFRNKDSPRKSDVSSVTKKIIQRKAQKSNANGSQSNSHSFSKNHNSSLKRRSSGSVKVSGNTSVRRTQQKRANNSESNKKRANFE